MESSDPTNAPVLLRLHILPGDPPHGTIELDPPDGSASIRRPFHGWVELIVLLNELRDRG